ncbi:alpha-L-fucosidase [Aspergillus sclerotioniger CBS 115572]|uniref:alpha-L-fucosidase n=1 Tax=Aspergillus sclerotioniger CBS 115572 TaxID=1450535 RepID=A0A317VVF2_9EURO|nr:alpha-L-fucosidase [Aspergillus sclerotioniger CBS 115572]PWY77331.1 alpha-L-fucosidase [Aspergillus sclerotioniger CBS 115572]
MKLNFPTWTAIAWHLAGSASATTQSTFISLDQYFNNKAFGTYPGETSFDALNQSYPDPRIIGINGTYTSQHTGIVYNFPGYRGPSLPDNVVCEGQTITVPGDQYFSASMLVTSDVELSTVSGNVTYTYSDNSTLVSELRSLPWWAFLTINRGEIIFPYRYTASETNFNTSHIFEYTAALDSSKTLRSITLPVTTNTTTGRLHVFSVSLWESPVSSAQVQFIRPTQKWTESGNQVVEVTINNPGSECISGSGIAVSLNMSGIQTIEPGYIRRLCPGDQKRVNIGVNGTANGTATVILDYTHSTQHQTYAHPLSLGLTEWTSDLSSLSQHESPQWFDNAKFGIMIHWGPYSVPGWGNSTPYESYAEWFWWYTTHRAADKSDTYDYRLRTFGPDWNYDDGFPSFTAANFSPKAWVDLIASSGAKYFVLTTKHHDGFALFDTHNTTNRSSLHYGPRRDLVSELFTAAQTHHPALKRGTYFSLPEWFNPDFGPYGFAQLPGNTSTSWPGIIARNPYTGLDEPYTGRIPVSNFIWDLMVPQMSILAHNYSTDILWCDCGAANGTAPFAADWFNTARSQNRQVTINSRCGVAEVSDFDTPEYATFSSAQLRKWESNMGMDPYSYGYNRATAPSSYMNASTIITDLVDMVSKNGNFLLDIGPRADGTIVESEANNLREAGKWIHSHSEAIFNTTYWFIMSEANALTITDGEIGVRFTQSVNAFYLLFLAYPTETVYANAPVPLLPGDRVTVFGNEAETEVNWTGTPSQGFTFHIPDGAWEGEEFTWVLKIEYLA